jgi:hypothetical protein
MEVSPNANMILVYTVRPVRFRARTIGRCFAILQLT